MLPVPSRHRHVCIAGGKSLNAVTLSFISEHSELPICVATALSCSVLKQLQRCGAKGISSASFDRQAAMLTGVDCAAVGTAYKHYGAGCHSGVGRFH